MSAIPSSQTQKEASKFAEIAGAKRLEKFGDFLLIDNLVKMYSVYTHEDLFDMEVVMVEQLILMNKTLSYVESNSTDIQRKVQTAKK